MADSIIKEVYNDLKNSKVGKVIILLFLIIIGLFAVWGSLPDSSKEKILEKQLKEKEVVPELKIEDQEIKVNSKVEVEKLASKWLASFLSGDAETLITLSSEPFYFDQHIILTKQQLQSEYLVLWSEYLATKKLREDSWNEPKIKSIKVQTARELEEQGYDLSRDRIFPSLNLTLDDYAITVIFEGDEGALLMSRLQSEDLEIVGFWD